MYVPCFAMYRWHTVPKLYVSMVETDRELGSVEQAVKQRGSNRHLQRLKQTRFNPPYANHIARTYLCISTSIYIL